MPEPLEREAYSILEPLTATGKAKHDAWENFFLSQDESDFDRRFAAVGIPAGGKAALRRLKFPSSPLAPTLPMRLAQWISPEMRRTPATSHEARQAQQALAEQMITKALPFATSTAATLALPGGGLIWPAVVAGLGAVPGAAIGEELEERAGRRPPARTPGEVMARLAVPAAEMAGGEFAGRAILRPVLRGVTSAVAGLFRRAAMRPENVAVKEASEELGLRLTPGQIAGQTPAGAIGRTLEFAGETSLLGRPGIEAARAEGRAHALRAVDDALATLSPRTSPAATGTAAQDAIRTGNRIFHEYAGDLYGQVDNVAAGIQVDVTPLKTEAQRIIGQKVQAAGMYPILGQPQATASLVLNQILSGPDQVPFAVAQQIRTKLMSISPQPGELVAKEAPGIAKHMAGLLTDAMDSSARALNPAAATAWATARTFWKEGHDIFERSLIQSLVDRNPELLIASIKPGAVTDAVKIKQAILGYAEQHGTPAQVAQARATWNQFREQFARTKLLADPEAGVADAGDLLNLKDRMTKMGPDMLRTIYGGDAQGQAVLRNLGVIGEAFDRVKRDLPFIRTYQFVEIARYVQRAMPILTAGATGFTAVRYGPGEALATFAAMEGLPALVGKIMYSPRATRYFVNGISAFAPRILQAPVQATTDALARYVPETSGLLVRAFVTALREDELRQKAKRAYEAKQRGRPPIEVIPPPPQLRAPIPSHWQGNQ